MALLRAVTHKLQDVLGIADLNGIRSEARVLAGGGAPLSGALAGAAVALLLLGGGVRAEGQGVPVLGEVGADRVVGAGADELPLVGDVADLDARVGGGAAVGAERAGRVGAGAGFNGLGAGSGEDGGKEGDEDGGELHFGWLVGR